MPMREAHLEVEGCGSTVPALLIADAEWKVGGCVLIGLAAGLADAHILRHAHLQTGCRVQ